MEQYLEDEYENWLSKVNKGKGIIGPDNQVDMAQLFKNLQSILTTYKEHNAHLEDKAILAFSDEMGSIWELREVEPNDLASADLMVGNEAEQFFNEMEAADISKITLNANGKDDSINQKIDEESILKVVNEENDDSAIEIPIAFEQEHFTKEDIGSQE